MFVENVQARKTTYEETDNEFRKCGLFAGGVGDLMVKALLANVIKYLAVTLTSIKSYPVIVCGTYERRAWSLRCRC